MTGSQTHRADDRLMRIVTQTIAEAPPKAKWSVVTSGASILFVVVVVVIDTLNGTSVAEASRMAALVIGILGIVLLSVALVINNVGQSASAAACGRMSSFRLEARVLHRVLLAVPVMAVVAGIMLAVALAVFVGSSLPTLDARPLVTAVILAVVGTMFSMYLVISVQMVAGATRFLYRHAAEQAEAAARARAEATEAQLSALQAQMNPHFLFNALNTVASLVRTNGRAAEATVENLAEILRRTLDRSRNAMGTVGEEVDYLEAYLAVEQERWGDRLSVEWQVAPDAEPLPLPPMTLQPLVENALKHGLGARLEGGALRIGVVRVNGRLELEVADDGVGFPVRYREGTGLGNLRQRLQTLYGQEAELRVERPERGSRVVVSLPSRPLPVPAAPQPAHPDALTPNP
jgi:sensor histidine kinase YesM